MWIQTKCLLPARKDLNVGGKGMAKAIYSGQGKDKKEREKEIPYVKILTLKLMSIGHEGSGRWLHHKDRANFGSYFSETRLDKQIDQEMTGRQTPCILMASQIRGILWEEEEATWG